MLITIDTLRADRVGAYGYARARTPHLDSLAARGVRFEHAYATAPITLPSHASLMTGRYPPGHGARHNGMRVDAAIPSLAKTLSAAGFASAAFVSAFPLDKRFGLNAGFAAYSDRMPRGTRGRPENESRALNRAALGDHLCYRWPDPGETYFASVRRVPPGWRAIVSGGRMRLERYWDPVPQDRPVEWLTDDETARFDEVFDRAVDRCLHNGPTGIFLSGGLDSISIAAVAADRARRNGQSPPWALSLGFPDPECDERLRQAAVARDLGLPQHLVDFDEAVGSPPLFEQSLGLAQKLAAPILNAWFPAYLGLARRARLQGVRTILTGNGGDEWLTVTPFLAADLIRRGALVELARFYGVLQRSNPFPLMLARNVLFKFGLRPLAGLALHRLMPEAHKASRLNRLLAGDPSWIVTPDRDLRAEQRRRADGALTPSDPPQGFYLREGHQWMNHMHASWGAEERYEVGKQIGVCFFHPFFDADVVEVLYRTPPRLLNKGGRSKGVVRGVLARRFPTLGLDRQRKVAATSFFQSMLQREGRVLADAAGDFPALSELGIIDGRAARAAVREGLKRRGPGLSRIWEAVNLEVWVRSNGGQQHG